MAVMLTPAATSSVLSSFLFLLFLIIMEVCRLKPRPQASLPAQVTVQCMLGVPSVLVIEKGSSICLTVCHQNKTENLKAGGQGRKPIICILKNALKNKI